MAKFLSNFIGHPNFFRISLIAFVVVYIVAALLNSLNGILTPFISGIIGAYLFDKVASRMEKYIPRTQAAILLILAFVVTVIFATSVVLPYIQMEFVALIKGLPYFADVIMNKVQPLISSVDQHHHFSAHNIQTQLSNYVGDIVKWSVQIVVNLMTNGVLLANVLTLVILTPIVMFYLLRDWRYISNLVERNIPITMRPRVMHIIRRIDKTLMNYMSGQATVCGILCVLYAIGLFIVGIKKCIFLGVMTGILSFIPYLGMTIGLFASLSIAFTDFVNWSPVIGVLIVYAVIALIEGNILTPRFVGGRIGLHPVIILFSLLAFGTWFGFDGVLVAIPSTAVVGVLLRELFQKPSEKTAI